MVRIGPKKAAVAVGHSLLIALYYVLARHEPYRDLSPAQLDADLRARATQRAKHQLEALGFAVILTPKSGAA